MMVAVRMLQDVLHIFLLQKTKGKNIWRAHLKHTHSFLKIGTTVVVTMLSVFFLPRVCGEGGGEE